MISDAGDNAGDAGNIQTVSEVDGNAVVGSVSIAGAYGTLTVSDNGFYTYVANSNLDALQVGDNPTEQFSFTVSDTLGHNTPTTLTFNVLGADDAPVITAADSTGTMTEDLGPTVLNNGSFETGDLTGWSASGSIQAVFLGLGGQFGNYAAHLGPSGSTQSLSQSVSTTPGQHYTVSFYVLGDPDASSNELDFTWDGVTYLAQANVFGGLTQYTFDVRRRRLIFHHGACLLLS